MTTGRESLIAALPEKGQRIRVTRFTNDCGQRLEPFEGVVEGIEFRLNPPIVSVVENGRRHDIQNFGNGSAWEPDDRPDEEYEDDDLACTHCGGEGTCEAGCDPGWYDDIHDCHACKGTGNRGDQVIF